VENYKYGKNQTQVKQLVAAKVWLGKLWLGTKRALHLLISHSTPKKKLLKN
jgi:hypothetical protein